MQNPYRQQAQANREELLLHYAPHVRHIANRLAARLPFGFQVEDLIQAGMIGLLEAIDKFDPQKGAKFKTFADIRVRGAMLDDLRNKDWIPRSVRDAGRRLERAFSSLRSRNIDHPSDVQLAAELKIKPQELPNFLEKARPIPLLPLEDVGYHPCDDESLDILETVSDPEVIDPLETLLGKELKEKSRKAIERLSENEQVVLSLYYNEDLNLKEIGKVLGLTESRVSQIRTKAIAKLRSHMKPHIAESG